MRRKTELMNKDNIKGVNSFDKDFQLNDNLHQ